MGAKVVRVSDASLKALSLAPFGAVMTRSEFSWKLTRFWGDARDFWDFSMGVRGSLLQQLSGF
ncbi:MAG: hypothetical protein WCH11_06210 [Bdellovibrio sp.]